MPEVSVPKEEAAEGRTDDWGEVVTRQPYRKVRLDHLLSKDKVGVCVLFDFWLKGEESFRRLSDAGENPYKVKSD